MTFTHVQKQDISCMNNNLMLPSQASIYTPCSVLYIGYITHPFWCYHNTFVFTVYRLYNTHPVCVVIILLYPLFRVVGKCGTDWRPCWA